MTGATGTQMILGLIIGVAVLVYLILKTKIHAFPALIIAASLTGLIGGMQPSAGDINVAKSITTGFGNTLSSIGIVIGFGVLQLSCPNSGSYFLNLNVIKKSINHRAVGCNTHRF